MEDSVTDFLYMENLTNDRPYIVHKIAMRLCVNDQRMSLQTKILFSTHTFWGEGEITDGTMATGVSAACQKLRPTLTEEELLRIGTLV